MIIIIVASRLTSSQLRIGWFYKPIYFFYVYDTLQYSTLIALSYYRLLRHGWLHFRFFSSVERIGFIEHCPKKIRFLSIFFNFAKLKWELDHSKWNIQNWRSKWNQLEIVLLDFITTDIFKQVMIDFNKPISKRVNFTSVYLVFTPILNVAFSLLSSIPLSVEEDWGISTWIWFSWRTIKILAFMKKESTAVICN